LEKNRSVLTLRWTIGYSRCSNCFISIGILNHGISYISTIFFYILRQISPLLRIIHLILPNLVALQFICTMASPFYLGSKEFWLHVPLSAFCPCDQNIVPQKISWFSSMITVVTPVLSLISFYSAGLHSWRENEATISFWQIALATRYQPSVCLAMLIDNFLSFCSIINPLCKIPQFVVKSINISLIIL
jgi:hypothetical protein